MEIEFFGANCFRVKTKITFLVVDDNLDKLGAKNITRDKDTLLLTNKNLRSEKPVNSAMLVLDTAGEFEIGDVSIKAIRTRGHMDDEEEHNATVYQFRANGTSVVVLGHIHPNLSTDILELVSGTDVLILPVGGNGFTLDVIGAMSVIKQTEPEVVIPSSYNLPNLRYEVPVASLEEFTKASSLSVGDPQDSYKVGDINPELTGQIKVVILNTKKI